MSEAWYVVRAALRDTWSDLLTTAVVSLMWLGLTLLLVPAPPAALALFYVGNRLAHGDPTDPGDFWQAFRRYFRLSWRWGALQLGVLVVLVGDVVLSARLGGDSAIGRLAQGFYLAALAAWLLLQLYTLAFLFEQEQPRLRTALRNGAVMMGQNPLFSVALGFLLLALLAVGIVFFFVTTAVGGVFVALAGNHAVLNRLATHRSEQRGAGPRQA
jgi:uncharacterized membrane protein YesL